MGVRGDKILFLNMALVFLVPLTGTAQEQSEKGGNLINETATRITVHGLLFYLKYAFLWKRGAKVALFLKKPSTLLKKEVRHETNTALYRKRVDRKI